MEKTVAKIVMIPIDHLNPHPDNPRKDVGDVKELAESIKANGILQNLTVVPYKSPVHNRVMAGMYTVIIGHRRLAAATLAGLETVPCVIADMTEEEQLSTMLTENMQRTDLTVYEQAKAFEQLHINLGMSEQQIADKSGFSVKTVKSRIRLAELDEDGFKKAVKRGATLFDFEKLYKLELPEDRNKCLEALGTNNFGAVYGQAMNNQEYRHRREKWLATLDTFAKKIEQSNYVNGKYTHMVYVNSYGSWTHTDTVAVPNDADTVDYYYVATVSNITLYKASEETDWEKENQKREAQRAKDEEEWNNALEVRDMFAGLRREFVKNYGAAISHRGDIMRFAEKTMMYSPGSMYRLTDRMEDLCKLLDIPYNKEQKLPDIEEFERLQTKQPERVLLLMAYWLAETASSSGYIKHVWNAEKQRFLVLHAEDNNLDRLYEFLCDLGYQMSDEEIAVQNGTSDLIYKEDADGSEA